MSARLTQAIVESLIIGIPGSRLTQEVLEVLISNVVTPAKSRVTQYTVEAIIVSVTPPAMITRYGPRIQSV